MTEVHDLLRKALDAHEDSLLEDRLELSKHQAYLAESGTALFGTTEGSLAAS